jgi:hypothetical protein
MLASMEATGSVGLVPTRTVVQIQTVACAAYEAIRLISGRPMRPYVLSLGGNLLRRVVD